MNNENNEITALEEARRAIDYVDDRIVELLERRAEIAVGIGIIKCVGEINLISRKREREIIERLRTRLVNFPESALRVIYREIHAAMIDIQLGQDRLAWKVEPLPNAVGWKLVSGEERILLAVPKDEVERLNAIARLHNDSIRALSTGDCHSPAGER